MKRLIFFLFLLIFAYQLSAQFADNLRYGLKAGAGYSKIGNIPSMIVSDDAYSDYSFSEDWTVNPYVNLFVNYKVKETLVALEGSLSYYQLGANAKYSDIKDLNYKLGIKYDYIGVGAYIRTYYYEGFNVAAGLRMGFNVNTENLKYRSNKEDVFGPDSHIEQQMRQVIKGRNNIAAGIVLGYESPKGWLIDLSYHHGLNDAIQTQVNPYDFVDNSNRTQSIQLTIGWSFPFGGMNF